MRYQLQPTPNFLKQLAKLDPFIQKRLISYLERPRLLKEPRTCGKALVNSRGNQWRYQLGDYRIIVEILDDTIIVLGIEVGHRHLAYDMAKSS